MNDITRNALQSLEPYVVSAAIINKASVRRNYNYISELAGANTVCSAVVKADAYGLGATELSPVLELCGCNDFFVATIDEGMELRAVLENRSSNIYVLGGVLRNTEEYFTKHDLIPVLVNDEQLSRWVDYSVRLGRHLPCIMHVDTGMTRNGFNVNRMKAISADERLSQLDIRYIMSHFACADDVSSTKNSEQISAFDDVCAYYPGIKKSISSTNGIFLHNRFAYDMIRVGKALYGFAIRRDLIGTLAPVVEIYARIVQVNEIGEGVTVGYGATFTSDKNLRLITVGMGYADGLMRKLQQYGYAYLHGYKIPMVGRISMDYAVFDVTNVPSDLVRTGDWISFAHDDVTLERMAIDSGTIPHEITCKLGRRVRKVYVDHEC